MRNLKKMLSLVMALAMIASFMVVGASAADFTDAKDIKNTDAVGTLVSLGIVKGRDTGAFDPTGNVTRAEMAKMICVALNGGLDPNLTGGGLFPDTKGHWASGYIDSCVKQGIVAGNTDGKFYPDKTVTATEAAKMILIAIGYKADMEKFVNDVNWSININVVAGNKGLYKGLAIDSSAALIRDNAAQMIFNGLNATMVKYEMVGIVNGNGVSQAVDQYVGNTNVPKTILTERFEMVTEDPAILTGVTRDPKGTYTLTLNDTTTYTKVKGDYTALLGQSVKVLHKTASAAVEPKSVYGVYATEDNTVFTYNMSAASVDSGKIKVDGTKYTLDNVTTITDGVYSSTVVSASTLVGDLSYNKVSLIDNDADGKYEVAVITSTTAGKVTYASSTEIIAGGVNYKFDDENIAEGIAKNDYVSVTYNVAQDKKDIVKIGSLVGKVEGYKPGTAPVTHKYLVDGTWYVTSNSTQVVNAGDTVTLYALNGVIVNAEKGAGTSNLVDIVMAAKSDPRTSARPAVQIVFSDGTKKTVSVDPDTTAANYPTNGKLYTYSETDSGYKFELLTADYGDYDWKGTSGTVAESAGKIATIGGIGIADDAVIYVTNNDGTSFTMVTGKQFKNQTISGLSLTAASAVQGYLTGKSTSGLTRVMMASVKTNASTDLPDIGNSSKNFAVVVSGSYKADSSYITYKIWDGSSVVTVREKSSTASRHAQFDVVAYSSIDGDIIKDVTKPALGAAVGQYGAGAVYGIDGDNVWINGSSDAANMYKITKDTQTLYVDNSKDTAADIGFKGGEIQVADKVNGTYVENVHFIVNSSNELQLLVVDVRNNIGTKYATSATTSVSYGGTTYTISANAATAKANSSVTYTITAPAGVAPVTTIKVSLDGQDALVTIPATTATQGASVTVSFLQPAAAAGAITFAAP